jgi:hypothetical protein
MTAKRAMISSVATHTRALLLVFRKMMFGLDKTIKEKTILLVFRKMMFGLDKTIKEKTTQTSVG